MVEYNVKQTFTLIHKQFGHRLVVYEGTDFISYADEAFDRIEERQQTLI
jgi:hypothetical protein